jgi:SAM-dependent methyltransferase
MHEANRQYWNASAAEWGRLRDQDELWLRCPDEPALAFEGQALAFIRQFVGDLTGQQVCVLGSGDNYAAFALAGLGATVVSTDISQAQLDIAARRADRLGLDIRFVRCDAADLAPLPAASFDLVCSTNGFFVWIAEPAAVFAAAHRVLKPGGHYVFYDVHPFQRPWEDQLALEMAEPYFETGPFMDETPAQRTYEFHWTMADLINPLLAAGLRLRRIAESPADDSRFWRDHSYRPGTDEALLDWQHNPRAGLPVWLTVAAVKAEKRQADVEAPGG